MQRPEGVTLIAIWFFLNAGCAVLGLGGMLIGFLGLWAGATDFQGALFGTLGMSLGVLAILGFGIAYGLVGWGLWKLKDWARSAAIALAIVQLVLVPIGTVLGILTLVYLSRNPQAKLAFTSGTP